MACSPPGSSLHGISQARILEWVAIFLLQSTCRSLLNVSCIFSSISSVQLLSHVRLFAAPWTAAYQASLSITNSRSLLKLMPIESVMPSSHLILCHPLLLLPSIFPSTRVFSNESALRIRWPKYWSFSFSISPSNEYSGPVSFRMDWLDLLAVQGTLKSLTQNHSSKTSILWCSAFFIVQLVHPYMITRKTIALTRWTFVGKVMSLLFNMLSRLVITFLPRSKCFLISWLQSPSAVILEPKNIKSVTVSPSICCEVMGPDFKISTGAYVRNLEKWSWWIYFQGSNGETGIESRSKDTGEEEKGEGEMDGESNIEIYNTIYKIDSQWEFVVWVRELKQGLCDHLEGWDGEGDGREVWEGVDMGVPTANSYWCMRENHKIL